MALTFGVLAVCMNGCGAGTSAITGGAAAVPGGLATAPAGASTAPGGTTPTKAPGTTSTATPSAGGATPTPVPVASNAIPPPTSPPAPPGITNTLPAMPPAGQCRPGQIVNPLEVVSPTGDTMFFTLFEPQLVCSGKTYPLVFQAPGWGGKRFQTLSGSASPNPTEGENGGNNITMLVDNNYGVISFDQTGFGQSVGKIRSMDPDHEGHDYLTILNWAQANIPWLAYGPTLDGTDPHEPIFGATGLSYGGMFEYMLVNVDKRHRMRAIGPNIAPNDLNFALYPGGVIKTLWGDELFGDGAAAGNGTPASAYDPFLEQSFINGFATNSEDAYSHDFFGYHSADYFCNGMPIATNGGPGTAPELPPTTVPPKVNAMIWIGVRDTLFDFDNGYRNYECFKQTGGDTRLLSYQAGHNTGGTVPDPYLTEYSSFYPANDDDDTRCGKNLSEDAAELAWFNQYLKGQSGAASIIPTSPCISLIAGDGVSVPNVPTYAGGSETAFNIGSMNAVAGAGLDVPIASTIFTATTPTVYAGIPHMVINVAGTAAGVVTAEPILFIGLGVMHASQPGTWDLVDNQIQPIRGIGQFDEDMVGGGIRLAAGDQLAFLVFGAEDQFASNGNVSLPAPAVVPVTVTGNVYIPFLGPVSSI
jgi:ABC-2 type transport system ATP-binding protein